MNHHYLLIEREYDEENSFANVEGSGTEIS